MKCSQQVLITQTVTGTGARGDDLVGNNYSINKVGRFLTCERLALPTETPHLHTRPTILDSTKQLKSERKKN